MRIKNIALIVAIGVVCGCFSDGFAADRGRMGSRPGVPGSQAGLDCDMFGLIQVLMDAQAANRGAVLNPEQTVLALRCVKRCRRMRDCRQGPVRISRESTSKRRPDARARSGEFERKRLHPTASAPIQKMAPRAAEAPY
jgi:hypothetical protein